MAESLPLISQQCEEKPSNSPKHRSEIHVFESCVYGSCGECNTHWHPAVTYLLKKRETNFPSFSSHFVYLESLFHTGNCEHISLLLYSYSYHSLLLFGCSDSVSSRITLAVIRCLKLCHVCLNNWPGLHQLFGPLVPTAHPLVLSPPSSSSLLPPPPSSPWPVLRSEDGGSRWSSTSSRRGTLRGRKGLTAGHQI